MRGVPGLLILVQDHRRYWLPASGPVDPHVAFGSCRSSVPGYLDRCFIRLNDRNFQKFLSHFLIEICQVVLAAFDGPACHVCGTDVYLIPGKLFGKPVIGNGVYKLGVDDRRFQRRSHDTAPQEIGRSVRPYDQILAFRGIDVSTSTVRDVHKLLRNCFNQAVKWELMERNPAVNATVPKHVSRKRDIWTAETLFHALQVCDSDRLKLALNLEFSCSLRIGEMLALTWDCVDISPESIEAGTPYIYVNKELQRLERKALDAMDKKDIICVFPAMTLHTTTIQVLKSPKTDSSVRKIFLPKTVANMLTAWKKDQDFNKEALGSGYQDFNLVFANPLGNPIESSTIRSELKKLIEDNDLPPMVFHSFRHSLQRSFRIRPWRH